MEQNINLFSKKTNFKKIDLRLLDDIKYKKFFELSDLSNLFPDARVFIIKGKKNIGKTYSMLEKMKEIVKNNEKFLFVRLSDSEVKSVISEWKQSPSIPFTVRSKIIYTKDKEGKPQTPVGLISDIKNTQKLRSLQYEGYTHLFFDEFVPFNNLTLSQDIMQNIIRLIIDVQRNKPDLYVWCFGNNETHDDIFTRYFNINFDHPFWYDENAKTIVCNLGDYYEGGERGIGFGLSFYDDNLRNYLNTNTPIKDVSLIKPMMHDDYLIKFCFIYNERYYMFLQEIYQNEDGYLTNKRYTIKNVQKQDTNKYKVIAFNNRDYIYAENSSLLLKEQIDGIRMLWRNMLKKRILTFSETDTESKIMFLIE